MEYRTNNRYNWSYSFGNHYLFCYCRQYYVIRLYSYNPKVNKSNMSWNGAPASAPEISRSGRQLYASAPPDSAGVTRYNWYADGTLITGVNGSTYYAATDATYTVSFVNPCGTGASSAPLTISSKQDQSITFDAIVDKTFGDAPFVVHATASSGLPIVYSI